MHLVCTLWWHHPKEQKNKKNQHWFINISTLNDWDGDFVSLRESLVSKCPFVWFSLGSQTAKTFRVHSFQIVTSPLMYSTILLNYHNIICQFLSGKGLPYCSSRFNIINLFYHLYLFKNWSSIIYSNFLGSCYYHFWCGQESNNHPLLSFWADTRGSYMLSLGS